MNNLKHDAKIVKQAWVTPSVIELPRLTDLTLTSSAVIGSAPVAGGVVGAGDASAGTFGF